ncbi:MULTISPECIES: hypothetical protein [Arthrobacter]|uniref:Uncharacterized protein n=1 Tax=Arthrobacter oryzae TaxID=409290 RepID=A0A3N0C2C9_9MICC|nr:MULTISPECIES: hypothetical protein [Arthrobacter]QYF90418.1 hypothetical protein KY499_03635 [Arthrobacter sp. PAMC25284]RNL55995.1 hypothetical protein D7003_09230 [Arthrobacter oryzae]
MDETSGSPSPAQAQALLARADSIGAASTNAAAWPVAMIFTSLAILGSMLMIGMQIVSHTGYGAPLLATSAGVWAAATASIWPMFQRSTKAGYTKRYLTSLAAYFALYGVALGVGVSFFRDGNLWFYIPAAIVLGGVGLAAAFRELRA